MSIPPHWYARWSHLTHNLLKRHLTVLYTPSRHRNHPMSWGPPSPMFQCRFLLSYLKRSINKTNIFQNISTTKKDVWNTTSVGNKRSKWHRNVSTDGIIPASPKSQPKYQSPRAFQLHLVAKFLLRVSNNRLRVEASYSCKIRDSPFAAALKTYQFLLLSAHAIPTLQWSKGTKCKEHWTADLVYNIFICVLPWDVMCIVYTEYSIILYYMPTMYCNVNIEHRSAVQHAKACRYQQEGLPAYCFHQKVWAWDRSHPSWADHAHQSSAYQPSRALSCQTARDLQAWEKRTIVAANSRSSAQRCRILRSGCTWKPN